VKGSFAAFLLVVVAGCACYRSSQEVLVHVTSGVPTGDIAQMGENADNASTRATFGQVIRLPRGSSCLLYTSPSPRDRTRSRMPSSA